MEELQNTLLSEGFCWVRQVLSPEQLRGMDGVLDQLKADAVSGEVERQKAGIRIPNVAIRDMVDELLGKKDMRRALDAAVGGKARLIRSILFDKSDTARWFVAWHRDTMIPVQRHLPSDRLVAPSRKDGVPHVRATKEILSGMITLRLHMDAARADNGALRVIPGSHTAEEAEAEIESQRLDSRAVVCQAEPGDVLLMRPLLLHSSRKPVSHARRRVFHLEFAGSEPLPDGYEWYSG